LGDGRGAFTLSIKTKVNRFQPYTGGINTKVVDLNSDGYLDIISHYSEDAAFVWLGKQSGEFQEAITLQSILSGQPVDRVNNITPVDVNGDRQVDLIINRSLFDGGVRTLQNVERTVFFNTGTVNGNPQFKSQTNASTIIASNAFDRELVDDFNQDGNIDLLLSENTLLGDGNGNFSNPQPYVPFGSRLVTDFNQDGSPDIVSVGLGNKKFSADILLGDGNGRFSIPEQYVIGSWEAKAVPTGPITVADFNRDGRPDIVGIYPDQKHVVVYLNQATGRSAVVVNKNRLNASGASGSLKIDLKKKQFTIGQERRKTQGIFHVIGTRNNDRLTGQGQRNILLGSDGNDVINGLGNDDLLIGGTGIDRLTGGSGRDRFQLGNYRPELRRQRFGLGNTVPETPYKPKYGYDIITDFDVNADKIEITSSWFNTYAQDKKGGEYSFSFKTAPDQASAKRSSALIVYVAETGGIYYNPNRSVRGFAQGGLIADLTDGLQINSNHFITGSEDTPSFYSI
jgi:Ca2+-binding RTX toxin-like protein